MSHDFREKMQKKCHGITSVPRKQDLLESWETAESIRNNTRGCARNVEIVVQHVSACLDMHGCHFYI